MVETRSFCEIYTRKILPVIRAYIACTLVKQYKMPQLRVAKILGIKQPSVNYLVTGRRKVKCMELVDAVPGVKKILDEYIAQLYMGKSFDPCVVCDYLNSDKSLIKDVFSYLGETSFVERRCITSSLSRPSGFS